MKVTKNTQTVIFDMDGVIFDTENLCIQLWLEVAGRHGIKKDVRKPMYESIGTNIEVTSEIFKNYFGKDFPFEQYKEEVRAATRAYINEQGMPIKQGACELLKYLKEIPEPDIFLKCCNKLGINPNEAFIIEDSYNGIRAANRAGAIPIMVPDLLPADDEMIQLSFKIYNNLDEVRLYIGELKSMDFDI